MKIYIVDAGCGIGKTTSIINLINESSTKRKFIFITPFLSEVERIKDACREKCFVEPKEISSKTKNFTQLIKNGYNIVTTHALFKRIEKETFPYIKKYKYTLIIDESISLIDEISISKSDLKILDNKCIKVEKETNLVSWIYDDYMGEFKKYKEIIQEGNVYADIGKNKEILGLFQIFSPKSLMCFSSIYLLTYLIDGQIQKLYFDYFKPEYTYLYVKNFKLTEEKQKYNYKENKSKICICEKDKLNKIGEANTALSKNWFVRNKNNKEIDILKKNIANFFRTHTESKKNERLWTTFKEYAPIIKNKGFASGFAPINARATNQFRDKKAIAYIGNRFLKPNIKRFLKNQGINVPDDFEEKFALSELIQFIYRSAIRDNKKIDIYIPSKRMRDLLTEWISKNDF